MYSFNRFFCILQFFFCTVYLVSKITALKYNTRTRTYNIMYIFKGRPKEEARGSGDVGLLIAMLVTRPSLSPRSHV